MRTLTMLAVVVLSLGAAQPFVYSDTWLELPADEASYGGVIVTASRSGPRTFNPLVSEESNAVVVRMMGSWEGAATLVWWPPGERTPQPRAARTVEFSEDGLVVDMELREGLKWSDGTDITVQDYLISYELAVDPETGGSDYQNWFVDGEPVLVEAIGARSLRFTYPGPDREALGRLALAPLPDRIFGEAYRAGGSRAALDLWGIETDPGELLFSGALRLVSFVTGERLVFERNSYFGEWNVDELGRPLPYLDGRISVIAEHATALNLFLTGQLDEFHPGNLDEVGVIASAVQNGDVDAVLREAVFPSTGYTFIVFNWNLGSDPAKEALFRSVEFRRAMAHLVDRDTMIELAFSGSAFPLYGAIHPTLTEWVHPDLDVPGFDPEAALELLAGVGYGERGPDGILTTEDGDRLSFRLVTNANNAEREQLVAIFADTARDVGVDVRVDALAFELLVDHLLAEGDDRPFEAILIGLTGGASEWPFGPGVFHCGEALHMWNKSGGCLSERETRIEELVRRGRVTLDDDAARTIAFEIQELMAEELPLLYLVGPAVHHAASPRVQGYLAPHLVGPFEGMFLPAAMWLR